MRRNPSGGRWPPASGRNRQKNMELPSPQTPAPIPPKRKPRQEGENRAHAFQRKPRGGNRSPVRLPQHKNNEQPIGLPRKNSANPSMRDCYQNGVGGQFCDLSTDASRCSVYRHIPDKKRRKCLVFCVRSLDRYPRSRGWVERKRRE